jgi:hypothetical protein
VLDECEGRTSRSREESATTSAVLPLFDRGPYDLEHNDERIFFRALIKLALESLEEAERLFKLRHSGSARGEYLLGDTVPVYALTLACALGLSGRVLLDPPQDGDPDPLALRLVELVGGWVDRENLGEEAKEKSVPKVLRDVLSEALEYHRYPMKNRLVALKILVDDRLLGRVSQSPAEADDPGPVVEQAEELLKLTNHYGSPWHFTPFQSGVTCALLWMRLLEESLWADDATTERNRRDLEDRRRKKMARAAQRDLAKSQEMYTMRRAFYEGISGLYYLYDDFNDRQIHSNHAVQMAGAELASLLKALVDAEDFRRPVTSPRAE